MPEGPSIVILKELVKSLHLEGEKILEVGGDTTIYKERMKGQTVLDFKSWGKHFLVCFEDFALRIHLMMFGSYKINERKASTARLSLSFKNAELNFYTCSLKYIEGKIELTYDWSADVMTEEWNAQAALNKINKKEKELVCDILLDQNIFSGVGNIIKNEVLFRIGVHPLSTINAIPLSKLEALVVEARQYSFDFLEWKKAYVLQRHWLVYSRERCPSGHPVQKKYLGKTKRITYFCPDCQELYKLKHLYLFLFLFG